MSDPYRNYTNLLTSSLNYAQLSLIDPNGPDDYRNTIVTGGGAKASRMPLSTTTANYDYAFSNQFIQDGSYIRLQSLALGYNVPQAWVSHAGISALKVYANFQNLFTLTKYKGMDPAVGEGAGYGGASINGFFFNDTATTEIYTVGINVTF
jgi:hypothetical protein